MSNNKHSCEKLEDISSSDFNKLSDSEQKIILNDFFINIVSRIETKRMIEEANIGLEVHNGIVRQ